MTEGGRDAINVLLLRNMCAGSRCSTSLDSGIWIARVVLFIRAGELMFIIGESLWKFGALICLLLTYVQE